MRSTRHVEYEGVVRTLQYPLLPSVLRIPQNTTVGRSLLQ
jgi:hypothetical protein